MTDGTELLDRLSAHAVPIARTDPGGGAEDLRPLVDVLEEGRVVGLGEATHGTREFFRLKHRLFGLLVTELGFRLFGLEANAAEVRPIDDYVVSGEGDPEAAIDGLAYWTWTTEELLALVEWVRRYNRGRPPGEKVRFYGYDVRSLQGPADALREFFERVDPDYRREIDDDLRTLAAGWPGDDREATKEQLLAADAVATAVADRFEDRGDAYRSATDEREWRVARRNRRRLEQACEFVTAGLFDDDRSRNGVRDAAMAENVGWILDHEDAERIALWAHNGHVRTGRFRQGDRERPPETMGAHLRREYGDRYYAIGFEFGRGAFRALPDPASSDDVGVRVHSMDAPRDGSIPAVLDGVDEPVWFLDVTSAADDPALGEWLARERPMHNVGAVCHDDPADNYAPVTLAGSFDGLVFVSEAEAAIPLDRG